MEIRSSSVPLGEECAALFGTSKSCDTLLKSGNVVDVLKSRMGFTCMNETFKNNFLLSQLFHNEYVVGSLQNLLF